MGGLSHPHRMDWLRYRFVPALGACALVAGLLGVLRAETLAFPGIQGMAAGGLLGFTLGWNARRDAPACWPFRARLALVLCAIPTYLAAHLGVFSFALARGADSPFFWLEEIAGGFQEEAFFSLGMTGPVYRAFQGVMTGGGWMLFNLLDGIFFGAFFLILLGVGLGQRFERPAEGAETEMASPLSRPFLTVMVCAYLVLGSAGLWKLWHAVEVGPPLSYSPASWRALERYAGSWRLVEERPGLFRASGDQLLVLRVAGFEDLAGESASGRFSFSVTRRGSTYQGLLYTGRREGKTWYPSGGAVPIRLRLAPDGSSLEGAVTVFTLEGRRDGRFRAVHLSTDVLSGWRGAVENGGLCWRT